MDGCFAVLHFSQINGCHRVTVRVSLVIEYLPPRPSLPRGVSEIVGFWLRTLSLSDAEGSRAVGRILRWIWLGLPVAKKNFSLGGPGVNFCGYPPTPGRVLFIPVIFWVFLLVKTSPHQPCWLVLVRLDFGPFLSR